MTQRLPMPTNDLAAYLDAVHKFPMLSETEERELAEEFRATSSREAAWRLVTSHLRFVTKLARGFRGYGLPEEDIIQEGNIGLMKAVKRFDPAVGVRLAAFAVHWIRAEIHEFVLRNWRLVRVATTKAQRKLFFNLKGARRALGQLSHEEAEQIAEDLGVKAADVLEMHQRLEGREIAFEGGADADGDDAWTPSSWLADAVDGPEDAIADAEVAQRDEQQLRAALESLDERSRDIVTRRYLDEPKAPLRVLADEYGVSLERIRQIEVRALADLRGNMSP